MVVGGLLALAAGLEAAVLDAGVPAEPVGAPLLCTVVAGPVVGGTVVAGPVVGGTVVGGTVVAGPVVGDIVVAAADDGAGGVPLEVGGGTAVSFTVEGSALVVV